jgi:nitrate reductase gamma subunit
MLVFLVANVLPYVAVTVFVGGLVYRLWTWCSLPVPVRLTIFPAPESQAGLGLNIAKKVAFLPGLYSADRGLWTATILFHIGLFTSLGLHLKYFAVPSISLEFALGSFAGLITAITAFYYFMRRVVIPRASVISSFEDRFALIFLLAIISLGTYMRIFHVVDHEQVWAYIHGLMAFNPVPPPNNPIFLTHLTMGLLYLMYIPFSKAIHSMGIFLCQKINCCRR